MEIDIHKIYKGIEGLGGITSFLLAAFAFILVWGRRLYRLLRSIRHLGRFVESFGPEPAEAIKECIQSIERGQTIADLERELFAHELELGLYVCDADGSCTEANETLADLFGLEREKFKGLGWTEAIAPNERKRVYESWMFSVKSGCAYNEKYTVHNKHTGEIFEVKTKALAVIDEDLDEVIRYVGYVKKSGQ